MDALRDYTDSDSSGDDSNPVSVRKYNLHSLNIQLLKKRVLCRVAPRPVTAKDRSLPAEPWKEVEIDHVLVLVHLKEEIALIRVVQETGDQTAHVTALHQRDTVEVTTADIITLADTGTEMGLTLTVTCEQTVRTCTHTHTH